MSSQPSEAQFTQADWSLLLSRIAAGACTPLLGAGVHDGRTPLPGDIALQWAEAHNYPLEDRWNLARVAQFVALEKGARWPRDELAAAYIEAKSGETAEPAPAREDDALQLLAELPFHTYVTTTPDDRLVRALRSRSARLAGKSLSRRPRADYCRWHEALRSSSLATVFEEDPHYTPSVEEPFVFHLHGQVAVAESLVVAEDDHFDMLVATARHPLLIPPAVQRALRGGPLLLLGQPVSDWNFRVLLRSLCGGDFSGLQAGSVTVHVRPPDASDELIRYLERLFGKLHIKVYWGTPQEFLLELRKRWDEAQTK
jgi:hypothetical protein